MSAPTWRQRREAYLRERGRWAELIREGYIQHRLTALDGSDSCKRGQRQDLILITNTAVSLGGAATKKRGPDSRSDAI